MFFFCKIKNEQISETFSINDSQKLIDLIIEFMEENGAEIKN